MARGTFEGMPGLRFRSFTLDDDGLQARNLYVWDDEEKARGFFTKELVDRVTGICGVAPEIDYLDVVGSSTTRAPDSRAELRTNPPDAYSPSSLRF